MEEILASIRRIISEDDAPPAEAAEAPIEATAVVMDAAPAPAPAPVEPEEDDDVLELTETVEAAGDIETVGDLDVYSPAKAAPEPAWEPEPEPEPAFTAAPEPAPAPSYTMGAASISGGMTIEELVRSILEPKLNEWADQNLPRLVEQIVRDKLSR